MARPSNTEQRRAQIAAGLMKVMAKHGYDGASIAQVAAAARLTPGLVHYHFKNKREILLAALEQLRSQHAAGLEHCLALAGSDSVKQVRAFIEFHLGLGSAADPDALACWILMSAEALREPRVRKEYAKAISSTASRLARVVRTGIEAGVFRADDPKTIASALMATIEGYFVLAATARDLIPRGSAAHSTKQMAEGLLRPTRRISNAKERR
jgi:TetR/AcrR family transcriptional repressor of bet genes